MTLSKRERFLIWFLVYLIVISAYTFFFFLPGLSNLSDKDMERTDLETQKFIYEDKIESIPTLQSSYKDLMARHELNKNLLIDRLTNEELDRLLTGMSLQAGLVPTSLSMTAINREVTDENEIQDLLFDTTASLKATGDYTRLLNLIETVRNTSYLRIKSVGYLFGKDYIPTFGYGNEPQTINITFDIFMKDLGNLNLTKTTETPQELEIPQ